MQMTLLEIVQDILSSLGSDEVNSISDTTESMQVATCVKTVYNNIISRAELPEMTQFFQLTSSNDANYPVLMFCPQGVSQIDWIKYFNDDVDFQTDQYGAYSHDLNLDIMNNGSQNSIGQAYPSLNTVAGNNVLYFTVVPSWVQIGQTISDITNATAIPANTTVTDVTSGTVTISNNVASPGVTAGDLITFSPVTNPLFYQEIRVLSARDFMEMNTRFNPLDGDVFTYQLQGMNLRYKNDKKPQYACVLQNYYVLFDSFEAQIESTLQSSKTMCYGQMLPPFIMSDTFVPDLDDKQVPLLFNESKALAFVELKQTVNPKAEQEAKRGWSTLQKTKSFIDRPTYFDQLANFGRNPQTGGYALTRRYR